MIVNAVCLVGCIGCVVYGRIQERKELEREEREDEGGMYELKQSQ
jgi:hypothetical protein